MKTAMASRETADRKWVVIDVQDKVLGRVSTQIASILRGKHKPSFTPHADCGDFVVVNADKVKLTGNKWSDKPYRHHTRFPGGLKTYTAVEAIRREPGRLIEDAVGRMLPRTPLGRDLMRKLKVYSTAEHPHAAQQPKAPATTFGAKNS